MRKTTCDECGQEIKKSHNRLRNFVGASIIGKLIGVSVQREDNIATDICSDCTRKIALEALLDGSVKEEEYTGVNVREIVDSIVNRI